MRAVYGNVAKPACRKFASNVRALRIPRFSMRTKEVQSVNDHRLSDRRTKSFQAAAKAGDSTRTRRRFFDCSIAWPAAEAISWRFARATRAARFRRANSARAATASPWESRRPRLLSRTSAAFRTASFCSAESRRVVILYACMHSVVYAVSEGTRLEPGSPARSHDLFDREL